MLTRRTAHERGPVSAYWLTSLFDGLPAKAAELREDRILDEARAADGDPLHIAAMFGLTAKPALRYAKTIWLLAVVLRAYRRRSRPVRPWFVGHRDAGVVVWDVDGTLIPADLRWLRRSIARTYGIEEVAVTFPEKKVHGYTDESIVIDTAIASGIAPVDAEAGIERFGRVLAEVMEGGRDELVRVQPSYPGAAESIAELHRRGFVQTVLTGNLRAAAAVKIASLGLGQELDLEIGGYGSDERDRFRLSDVVARRYQRKYGTVLTPSRTVVVGDAPNDIACARSAGFWAVVVTHRVSREELSAYDPDAVLDRLDPDLVASTIASLVRNSRPG